MQNTNNERSFFVFNRELNEYVYEGGQYLEYALSCSTSGTISIGTILSSKTIEQTLFSLKIGNVYLELSTLNDVMTMKKLTINSNQVAHFPGSVVVGENKDEVATKAYIDAKLAEIGIAEEGTF